MRIVLGGIKLIKQALLQFFIEEVLHQVRGGMQVVIRQFKVLLHVTLPQPVGTHNSPGPCPSGIGELQRSMAKHGPSLPAQIPGGQPAPQRTEGRLFRHRPACFFFPAIECSQQVIPGNAERQVQSMQRLPQ